MRAEYCVYKHTAPDGKIYIGITSQKVNRRWRNGNGYYLNKHFMRAIKKYGWENFRHEIVGQGLTEKEACNLEESLISKYQSNDERFGYNKSTGGEKPALGVKHSEETRQKMSKAHKGKKNTPEQCRKISAAKKEKPNGREGKLGKECPQAGKVLMIDESTGEIIRIFYGYDEVKREMGYARTPVRECAMGIRKRAYGHKWIYDKGRGKKDVAI